MLVHPEEGREARCKLKASCLMADLEVLAHQHTCKVNLYLCRSQSC